MIEFALLVVLVLILLVLVLIASGVSSIRDELWIIGTNIDKTSRVIEEGLKGISEELKIIG